MQPWFSIDFCGLREWYKWKLLEQVVSSETVKYCLESRRIPYQEWLCWRGPEKCFLTDRLGTDCGTNPRVMRQKNMALSPAEFGIKNNFAGEGQQKNFPYWSTGDRMWHESQSHETEIYGLESRATRNQEPRMTLLTRANSNLLHRQSSQCGLNSALRDSNDYIVHFTSLFVILSIL
jgi:hypothetical protein